MKKLILETDHIQILATSSMAKSHHIFLNEFFIAALCE